MKFAEIEEMLTKGYEKLQKLVVETSDADFTKKVDAIKWSKAEIVEHVAAVNHQIILLIENQMMERADVDDSEDLVQDVFITEKLFSIVYDDIMKLPAAEGTEPTGKVSRQKLLEMNTASHEKLIKLLHATQIKDLSGVSYVHSYFGRFSIYEWFVYLEKHRELHTKQYLQAA